MKQQEYFLYAKKTKITTLFNNSSPLCQRSAILEPHYMDMSSTFVYTLIWMKTSYPCGTADTEQRTQLCPADILQTTILHWSRGDELLNKVVIFVFFAYKKYSRSFITLRLNHWWQMDYFVNVFHTFLGLDSVNYLAVNGTVTSLLVLI